MKYTRSIHTLIAVSLLIVMGMQWGCGHDGHSAVAPNCKIVGIVTDNESESPIPGARVADNNYGGSPNKACQEAWTDENGRYELMTWYEEHTIVASAPGYQPALKILLTKVVGQESEMEMNFSISK
jgi:hypothetical protein